jgi:hypothetical protein
MEQAISGITGIKKSMELTILVFPGLKRFYYHPKVKNRISEKVACQ